MDEDTSIVKAEFRDLDVAHDARAMVDAIERGGYQRALTPMNQPIPADGYTPPAWNKIPNRTPKDEIRPVYDDQGKLLYKSVSTGYVVRTLDKVFHGHNWDKEIISFEENALGTDGRIEYVVALQVVGPGMFRPAFGIGSNIFNPKNKQDTKAKSIASALTAALKNAAKTMNIGRDFDEDDPEVQKIETERHKTIQLFINKLAEKGRMDEVLKVVNKHAPLAVLDDAVLVTSIDFEHLEPVQRELAELASKVTVKT